MVRIETFVIIDLETTGLPHQEYNRTKITEICLLAATRKDIKKTTAGKLPPMSKLSFLLNPEKSITPASARVTGITNSRVKNCPTFKEKFDTINAFLEDLKKPICLVAHNGYTFDYRILLAECADARVSLPHDLLCVDSLSIFRKITKMSPPEKSSDSFDKRASMNSERSMNSTLLSDIMTDDEDEWPELNVTPEEFQEIDELCASFSSLSATKPPKKLNKSQAKVSGKTRLSMKLSDIFKRYFGEDNGMTAHRAEDDCLMLLQCMVAAQIDFLKLSDSNCKLLSDCEPIQRPPQANANL